MPQISVNTIFAKAKKSFNKKYCLHPGSQNNECRGGIVRAHTIQRNGGLKLIAKEGHVYGCNFNFMDKIKLDEPLDPILKGINEASTFTGFCKFHDTKTFEPIEKHPFAICKQHIFLLGYRAICREVFTKIYHQEMLPFLKECDRGTDLQHQKEHQAYIESEKLTVRAGLTTLGYHKLNFDNNILISNYDNINYYAILISQTPDFMCSGTIFPECDFHGNILQDVFSTSVLDCITFSVIGTDSGGLILFSWLGDQQSCENLIKSIALIENIGLPNAIARLTFEFFENVYFSPIWWDKSSHDKKHVIKKRMAELSSFRIRDPRCLQPDYINYVDWGIIARETNLEL